jgi:hypothetical protein
MDAVTTAAFGDLIPHYIGAQLVDRAFPALRSGFAPLGGMVALARTVARFV